MVIHPAQGSGQRSTPARSGGLPTMRVHGYMLAMRRFGMLVVAAVACSGSPKGVKQVTIAPVPDAVSRGTFAGPLCSGDACRCRDSAAPADGGAGEPDASAGAVKRFEVRIGPSEHELWVTLDDMVLYKGTAHAEDCFYVDLPSGDHQMGLRASVKDGGVAARVAVSEYAAGTKSWYETFRFGCGAPGPCSHTELDEYKAALAQYKRGIHDPCGSVKVKQIGWDTGIAPDQMHPNDLQVAWTLELYDFAPKKPHGDPSCANRFE
jgi:hypothetical protein